METSGFYKNNNGVLLYGPNFVESSTFSLAREKKNDYDYPINGWFWFDSEAEARSFFDLQKQTEGPIFPGFQI